MKLRCVKYNKRIPNKYKTPNWCLYSKVKSNCISREVILKNTLSSDKKEGIKIILHERCRYCKEERGERK